MRKHAADHDDEPNQYVNDAYKDVIALTQRSTPFRNGFIVRQRDSGTDEATGGISRPDPWSRFSRPRRGLSID
jgi:hypothetical protein